MEKTEKPPTAEELLVRILELEKRHANMKQEISKLRNQPKRNNRTACPHQLAIGRPQRPVDGMMDRLTMKLTETQYLNILQSMGQAIFIYDGQHRIIFWNRGAEKVYGYLASEVIGKSPTELLAEPRDAEASEVILERTVNGDSWYGEFPIKNKNGESFAVICANTPYRDANGRPLGAMCLSSDSRPFRAMKIDASASERTRIGFDSQPPLQTSITSRISNLALKVKSKMKDLSDVTLESEGSTPRGHIAPSPFGVFFTSDTVEPFTRTLIIDSSDESENKHGIRKVLSSKAEEWIRKKRIWWPRREINEGVDESLDSKVGWHRFNVYQRNQLDSQLCESSNTIEASGLWLTSLHVSSTSSTSSSRSIQNYKAIIEVDREVNNLDYEILWEDLITKQQIGQGSCGTVYHGLWYGSDVAVKIFSHQSYSDDVLVSFRQEAPTSKYFALHGGRNFTSASLHCHRVSSTVGSEAQILQRSTTRLDWKRRLHMAVDIARGMNYLHSCHPPIVHRDLKSSNLLVDKNWTVKVGDFGLSRIKHQTYLNTKLGRGTPQWMAPEILRSEQADEKSDVYSYGVVLWEIMTEKIPWDDLNPMQVVGAVGFMNRRLDIPEDMDPLLASLIESCWCSEPQSRPTFQEIIYKLKELQKKFAADQLTKGIELGYYEAVWSGMTSDKRKSVMDALFTMSDAFLAANPSVSSDNSSRSGKFGSVGCMAAGTPNLDKPVVILGVSIASKEELIRLVDNIESGALDDVISGLTNDER
ncbi:PAC motif-containing protein [Tanacetum coccineum]